MVKRRQVDCFFPASVLSGVFFGDQIAGSCHGPQHRFQGPCFDFQHFGSGLQQLRFGCETVPVVRETVQHIQQAATQALWPSVVKAQFFRDRVGRVKADTPDIIGQPVGVLLHHTETVGAVGFKDSRRVSGADIMTLQKQHDIPDFLLFLPASCDSIHPQLPDAIHFQELFRILFNDVQGLRTELLHNAVCKLRADAFDQAAAQIFFNSVGRGGHGLFKDRQRELPAVLCIDTPVALQLKDAADMRFGHDADHSHQILKTPGAAAQDGIAVFLVPVGNAFDRAAQLLHAFHSPPSVRHPPSSSVHLSQQGSRSAG